VGNTAELHLIITRKTGDRKTRSKMCLLQLYLPQISCEYAGFEAESL